MSPLKFPYHTQQLTLGYCLPACIQMALLQLDIEVTQTELANILETRPGLGTPFSSIKKLIYYFDPALAQGPVSVLKDEFLLAWSQMSEQVTLLKALK